jgi:hypothetical protein
MPEIRTFRPHPLQLLRSFVRAYLRLVDVDVVWQNRIHFFAALLTSPHDPEFPFFGFESAKIL